MPAPAQYRLQSYGRPTAVSSLLQCPINFLSREGRKEGRAEGALLSLSLPRDYSVPTENNNFVRYVGPMAPRPSNRLRHSLHSPSLKCTKPRFREESRCVS